MTDTVRCPACRGAKKVPKLGGMIGECNTCSGKGNILAVDKPVPVFSQAVEDDKELINAVSNAVVREATLESLASPIESHPEMRARMVDEPHVDGKKALYKRKSK